MELSGQMQTFWITIAAGIVLGLLFDLIRLMKGCIQPGFLATNIFDLVYWLLATVIVFAGLLVGNWGEVRLYVFFGLLIGGSIYFRWCSRPLRTTLRFIGKAIKLLWRGMIRIVIIICWPARWLIFLALHPLHWCVGKVMAWMKRWFPKPPASNPPVDE